MNEPIKKGAKVIVGLGDSFTQGVGGYPSQIWTHYGKINCLDPKLNKILEPYMFQGSWVNQLCVNHLPDYQPINLGRLGVGNRAAVKELYLNPDVELQNASDVIVVLMLSGIERFDFVNKDFPDVHHFFAMWPNPWDKNTTNKKLWECYAEDLWSEKFVAVETIMNIVEAQTFCKAHGYKFVVASAFDQRVTREWLIENLGDNYVKLVDTIDWTSFIRPQGCKSFMELLLTLEGNPEMIKGSFYDHYSKLDQPSEYITPCVHPSKEGYRVMAEEIYNFLQYKQYV
jgi:lysophospholipase L1-like esterase